MAQLRLVSFCAFFLLIKAVCVLGEDSQHHITTLGDPVTFSTSDHCRNGEDFTLTRRLKDNNAKRVGAVVNGVWVPEEDYKDRVKHIPNTSVVLTDVTYNDKGLYELTCGSRFVAVQLDVIVPYDILGTERETVKLPYYSVTAGEREVEFIRWEKNGKLVCELNLSSRKVTYGTEFEGRVCVSPDWFSRGDLSLKLERAQPEDEGDFFIYKQDKTRKKTGHPAAVRLKFKEKSSNQIAFTPMTAPPPHNYTEEKGMETWAIGLITVFVTFVVVAPLAGWFGWWLKSRRTSGHSDGGPSTDVKMGLVSDTGRAGSQNNGVL